MRTIKIQEVERKDDVMVATVAVMEGETELFGRNFSARSKQELDGTIANLYREVNKIDDEIAKVEIGTWTPPTPEPTPEPVPPTAEELKAQAISDAEATLEAEIETYIKMKQRAEILPEVYTAHALGLQLHAIQLAQHAVTVAKA